MFEYVFVYIVCWLSAIFGYFYNSEVVVRCALFFQVLIMGGLSFFRYDTGYDWPIYQSHYESVAMGSPFHMHFELGYEMLVSAAVFLDFEFKYFIAVLGLLQVICLAFVSFKMLGRKSLVLMAIFFSMPDFFLVPNFSLLRQGLAASLFFIAAVLYFEKKVLKSFVVFLVSCFFHLSTLVALLVFFFVLRLKLDRWLLLLLVVSVLLYIFSLDLIRPLVEGVSLIAGEKYQLYLTRDAFNASLGYRLVSAFITILLFCFIYVQSCYLSSIGAWRDYNVGKLALTGLLIPLVFFSFPTIATRYFYFFSVFIVSAALFVLDRFTLRDRFIITSFVALIMFASLYRFLSSPLSIVYVPYQSWVFFDEGNSTGQLRTNQLLQILDGLWSR